ncbi:MAG: DUF5018-related domain-containing protein [Bacteroides sp.]
MKKFLNIFAALLVAVVATSCLEHDLETLEVFDGCDITRVDCEYRWKTGEIHPGTGAEKVNQVYISAYSRTYVTDEADPSKGVCTIRYSKYNIPAAYKEVAEKDMVVYVTISSAATIKPIGDAPQLGIPADWTADHQYEVTAANGNKKTWTIVVEAGD